MENLTTIKRDTNYSFIKIISSSSKGEFTRKLEKGSVDYSNACNSFHSKNIAIKVGNEITL